MTDIDEQNSDSGTNENGTSEQENPENVITGSVKQAAPNSEKIKKTGKGSRYVWLLLILIIILLLVSAGAYFVWQEKQKNTQQTKALEEELQKTQLALTQLEQNQQSLLAVSKSQETAFNQRLLAAEQRIQAQHKKLQGLTSTSREDWLLAEAEYLLRLANQRVLIERSAKSADGLLSEADDILKNLNDPDLFSLRQAIASDLAKLRLVQEVDQEGIYFSLKALMEQVDTLDLRPTRQERMSIPDTSEAEDQNVTGSDVAGSDAVAEENKSIWKKIGDGFANTFSILNQYMKFNDHSERPPALLPPDAASYLQQNLRLKIERAQLALLREDQKIYESSLSEVAEWLQRFYPKSQTSVMYIEQVNALREKNIVQILPDITYSLELLHQYIENLHQLDGVAAKKKIPAQTNGVSQ